eukprot:scaffold10546_cov114-Isochrysis_galbana.AAC.5
MAKARPKARAGSEQRRARASARKPKHQKQLLRPEHRCITAAASQHERREEQEGRAAHGDEQEQEGRHNV